MEWTECLNDLPLNILLVEDNQADVLIAARAFKDAKLKNNVFIVNDGCECLEYLRREGKYQDKAKYPWPDVIILDISMPKIDGFGVLKVLKTDPALTSIPVVMLSGSKNIMDIRKSYECGTNSFIQKPVTYEEFLDVINGFNYYWHVINRLPTRG